MKNLFLVSLVSLCFFGFARAQDTLSRPQFQNVTPSILTPFSIFTAGADPTALTPSLVNSIAWSDFLQLLQLCDPATTSLVRDETELLAAMVNPGINEIIVCGTIPLTQDITIPEKRLTVPKGSLLDISGGFSISVRNLNAGIYQIFTPSPTVPTTNVKVWGGQHIFPQWWDSTIATPGVDSWPAIQSAVNSNNSGPLDPAYEYGSQLYLKRGIYETSDMIDMLTPIIIRGENSFATIVRAVAPFAGEAVFQMSGEVDTLMDLRADGGDVAQYGVIASANTSEQAGLNRVRVAAFTDTGFIIKDGVNGSPRLINSYFINPAGPGTTAIYIGTFASQVSIVDTTIITTEVPDERYLYGIHAVGTGGLRLENINVENANTSYFINPAAHSTATLINCTGKDFTVNAFRFSGINLNWVALTCKGRQIPVLGVPIVNGLLLDNNRTAHNRDFPDAVENRVFTAWRGASTDEKGAYFPEASAMWETDNTDIYHLGSKVGVGAPPTRTFEVTTDDFPTAIISGVSTFNNPGAFGIIAAYKQKGAGAAAINDEANYVMQHKNDAGTRTEYASIGGGINSAAAGVENGYLTLETTSGGVIRQERMRVEHDGDVVIGDITATARFHVAGGDARFEGDASVEDRLLTAKGADVASANDITLGDGNYFDITGTTQVNTIASTGWTAGSTIILQFDAGVTVGHSQAGAGASILLAGGAFAADANDTLTLVFDGTTWRETARSVIP